MPSTEPVAACDRLIAVLERARALEARSRPEPDDAVRPPLLALAIAELRMRVEPGLSPSGLERDPFHVVLFGGTNSGKSTILNLLLGRPDAVMGARARLSQHPAAYRPRAMGDDWVEGFPSRFQGYRQFRGELPPRQSDEELKTLGYRPAMAVFDLDGAVPSVQTPASTSTVLWDAPDFSTEEARAYMNTVLDLAALADLVIVAVTDESYADHRGNTLLGLLADAGAEVAIVANKVPDSQALLDDIGRTIRANSGLQARVMPLPWVTGVNPEERLRRLQETPQAGVLRDEIARRIDQGATRKRQALASAVDYLQRHVEALLQPLADEAEVAAAWHRAVDRNTHDRVLEAYRRGYLDGVKYGEFNRILVRLMGLLQVPWIGPVLELTGRVVRTPLRLAVRWAKRLVGGAAPEPKAPPETEVLEEAIRDWLAALRAEAQRLAAHRTHSAWAQLAAELDADGFRDAIHAQVGKAYDQYRRRIDEAIQRRADEIYRKLQERPGRLAILRATNLVGSALSVALVIKTAGLDWSDAVTAPIVAGLWQNLLEWGMGRYLETQRAGLKEEQLEAVRGLVETNLAQPARSLFPETIGADLLPAARRDFDLIRAAASRVAAGGEP